MPIELQTDQRLTTKTRFEVLDGLRGIAAIVVVMFHICQFLPSNILTQYVNHGYLAVDFFYLLSGFVISYSYDDRWKVMSTLEFFRRRLIRLHPMVIMGMIIGFVSFLMRYYIIYDIQAALPVGDLIFLMIFGCLLIPLSPHFGMQGQTDMFPLDAPAWSLFFEYIANVLYAFIFRRLPKILLGVLLVLSAIFLAHMILFRKIGMAAGGWSLTGEHLHIGFARLLYPFLAGLFLSRVIKLVKIRNSFIWCALSLIVLLAMPRIGGTKAMWLNGLYESFAIICLFPLIVYFGACDTGKIKLPRLTKFLGDISYPIYIIHYPLTQTFAAWVRKNDISVTEGLLPGLLVLLIAVGLAYLSFKFYDVPVRRWLNAKSR